MTGGLELELISSTIDSCLILNPLERAFQAR